MTSSVKPIVFVFFADLALSFRCLRWVVGGPPDPTHTPIASSLHSLRRGCGAEPNPKILSSGMVQISWPAMFTAPSAAIMTHSMPSIHCWYLAVVTVPVPQVNHRELS